MTFFQSLWSFFTSLNLYLGSWGSTFLATLFFLAIIRVWFNFAVHIMTWRDQYEVRKTNWKKWREQTWEKHVSESIDEFENWKRLFR